MYKELAIIGNGFDLNTFYKLKDKNLNINTSYRSYYEFFSSKMDSRKISQIFPKIKGNIKWLDRWNYEVSNDMWSNFEEALSEIDSTELLDNIENWMQNCVNEANEHYDNDTNFLRCCFNTVLDNEFHELYQLIETCFKAWIREQNDKIPTSEKKLRNSLFYINFNFTETLQRYYNVSNSDVLHIHGSINDEELIVGHGEDVTKFSRENNSYSLKSYGERFDVNIDEKFKHYFKKDVKYNIYKLEDIIDDISKVEKIRVIGHSLGNVDLPYFKMVLEYTSDNTEWIFSYHNDRDLKTNEQFCLVNNIKKYRNILADDAINEIMSK